MSIYVVEDLGRAGPFRYRFSDPDAFLHCDNPRCDAPWVTPTGLVTWAVQDEPPSCTLFSDRVVVACGADCLAEALSACGRGRRRWSTPMAVGDWLDALRASLDLNPEQTPIGSITGFG